ncbi:bifunctional 3-deoxy-7-phosphoheptulonate synthase/chorismate mutase type II [Blattabacterium cuenoti]|uniref:bifunctional 3-deoxy-7-phosphoheptulonate synthase/chorismate mutase type II n=1 Tax=Blattabacterium cuenoti TaxID=1653831 RepID=UPI00163B814D|nr:bifunctional 3-deoxy-7-phosphoheptulonate synthase/chorismate mutase type II [Blattabacterium cuenoti]
MEKINNSIDRSWIDKFKKPLIISGPCSAESEKQIIETAKRLDTSSVQIFRAGIWKPRTKPNNFEGIGEKGLEWLRKVKKNTGLMIATEVANEEHVKLAISFEVDVLWIGARSTASPFTIQNIADALEKANDKIVLVKNPIHPDVELWIGALERLLGRGIKKLGVIHRGFYTYKNSKYRNQPNWSTLLSFRNILPRIPIICDPSHICGNKEGIFDIAKKAYYFQHEGLMIESHYDPDNAWSDSQQQITPEELLIMLSKLTNIKDKFSKKSQINLDYFRIIIDEIDENIISLLSERMNTSKKLGALKKSLDIDIIQPNRWNSIMNKSIFLGKKLGLDEKFLKELFKVLHQESIKIQNQIR